MLRYPKAQASGIAEVVKYGLIKDSAFFEWQEGCMEKMAARDEMVLAEAVERSCVNNAEVRRGGASERTRPRPVFPRRNY